MTGATRREPSGEIGANRSLQVRVRNTDFAVQFSSYHPVVSVPVSQGIVLSVANTRVSYLYFIVILGNIIFTGEGQKLLVVVYCCRSCSCCFVVVVVVVVVFEINLGIKVVKIVVFFYK